MTLSLPHANVASMRQGYVNVEAAVAGGERVSWSFGSNWRKYLAGLDDAKVGQARESLRGSLGDLGGRSFLDLGCGSGLFSLAAHLEGAFVTSVDVDPGSLACAAALADGRWPVVEASALDRSLPDRLGRFDIVYSWGVLHHTGAMWDAVENALTLAAPDGVALIALYNRPRLPDAQLAMKRLYNRAPRVARPVMVIGWASAWLAARTVVKRESPLRFIRDYGRRSLRGMSFLRDCEDWLGGLPYEYVDPREGIRKISELGYSVEVLREVPPGGNTEFLIRPPG